MPLGSIVRIFGAAVDMEDAAVNGNGLITDQIPAVCYYFLGWGDSQIHSFSWIVYMQFAHCVPYHSKQSFALLLYAEQKFIHHLVLTEINLYANQ